MFYKFTLIYQEALEENEKRVNKNPEYYRLRQQITEHQFGTLKRQWGFTFTLMKGKENVLSEVNLMMMVYNLRSIMSILGVNDLKTWIDSLYINILCYFKPLRTVLSHFNFSLNFLNKKNPEIYQLLNTLI